MDPRRAEDAALRPRASACRLRQTSILNLHQFRTAAGTPASMDCQASPRPGKFKRCRPAMQPPPQQKAFRSVAQHIYEQETNSDEQTRRDSFRVQQQWLHQQISQSEEFDEESEEGSPRAVATQGDIADMNWSPQPPSLA